MWSGLLPRPINLPTLWSLDFVHSSPFFHIKEIRCQFLIQLVICVVDVLKVRWHNDFLPRRILVYLPEIVTERPLSNLILLAQSPAIIMLNNLFIFIYSIIRRRIWLYLIRNQIQIHMHVFLVLLRKHFGLHPLLLYVISDYVFLQLWYILVSLRHVGQGRGKPWLQIDLLFLR